MFTRRSSRGKKAGIVSGCSRGNKGGRIDGSNDPGNRPNLLRKLPMRLHHHAYTTDDHERNRQFYEDVLGLPLVAMYVEREFLEGEWVELGHAFYGLGDGSALAFFNGGSGEAGGDAAKGQ